MAEGAVPLTDFDGDALAPKPGRPHRWFNAALPVLVVLVVTFVTLWATGRSALIEAGNPFGTASMGELGIQGLGKVFGEGNSFTALLYAAFGGCMTALLLSIGQRILTLGEALEAMIGGFKSMVTAFVILILAWGIAGVCTELHTSSFMVSALTDRLDPRLLPTLVFLFAAFTAFATGTSWGTMGILIPLAVPSAHALAAGTVGMSAGQTETIMLTTVASVLAGAIFGDHCSPISDTTVLSSMASGCDHVDHVRTQLPYALATGSLAILLGTLPVAYGVPVWICLGAGILTMGLGLRFFGRHSEAS
jgi:Na+/H+ antiporter NhaC